MDVEQIAAQLRKPHGSAAIEVAEFMNKGNVLLNRNTINEIEIKPNCHVLELGMGNGKFIPELFGKLPDMRYTGCDYSEEMVRAATEINQSYVTRKSASFICCDAENIPLEDDAVDVIFTVNTIYFWKDVDAVLTEFKRLLKPGGQLLIGLRPKQLMKNYAFVPYGFNLFSSEDVEGHLAGHNFKEIFSITKDEPDFVTKERIFKVESLVVKALNQ